MVKKGSVMSITGKTGMPLESKRSGRGNFYFEGLDDNPAGRLLKAS